MLVELVELVESVVVPVSVSVSVPLPPVLVSLVVSVSGGLLVGSVVVGVAVVLVEVLVAASVVELLAGAVLAVSVMGPGFSMLTVVHPPVSTVTIRGALRRRLAMRASRGRIWDLSAMGSPSPVSGDLSPSIARRSGAKGRRAPHERQRPSDPRCHF